ncbi:MAG: hypothetical protein LBR30_01080, partial [Clostridioides sp.]|nr:hypothetical protein [Clostridioides sp.]
MTEERFNKNNSDKKINSRNSLIQSLSDTIINHRKSLHCIGETGREEFQTAKYIREYLDKIGVSYETVIETGTVGIIRGNNPKKTVAFRADIDALNTTEGVKHLCGHDG